MPDIRSPWVNVLGAAVGGLALGLGIARMLTEFSLISLIWAVLGFLVIGWALLDRRRFQRGTPESEVNGGHTVE